MFRFRLTISTKESMIEETLTCNVATRIPLCIRRPGVSNRLDDEVVPSFVGHPLRRTPMSQPSSARSQISHQGSHSDRSRPRVMITLTGGGFLWEAKSLIRQLRDQVDLLYVTSTGDGWPKLEELGLPQGPIFVLPTVITFTERSLIRGAINATRGTLQATRILRKHRPRSRHRFWRFDRLAAVLCRTVSPSAIRLRGDCYTRTRVVPNRENSQPPPTALPHLCAVARIGRQ